MLLCMHRAGMLCGVRVRIIVLPMGKLGPPFMSTLVGIYAHCIITSAPSSAAASRCWHDAVLHSTSTGLPCHAAFPSDLLPGYVDATLKL